MCMRFGFKIYHPNEIIKTTCEVLQVSQKEIAGLSRKREIVMARQIAITLIATSNPEITLKQIGRMFGYRHHATILHSKGAYKDLYGVDKEFTKTANKVKQITINT